MNTENVTPATDAQIEARLRIELESLRATCPGKDHSVTAHLCSWYNGLRFQAYVDGLDEAYASSGMAYSADDAIRDAARRLKEERAEIAKEAVA